MDEKPPRKITSICYFPTKTADNSYWQGSQQTSNSKLDSNLVSRLQLKIDQAESRTFYELSPEYLAVCVVGLGSKNTENDKLEEINFEKELVRAAAAVGVSALQRLGVNEIHVDSFGDAEAAAEGITLKLWNYDELRNEEKRKKKPTVKLLENASEEESRSWSRGVIKANAQNLARRLADTPANLMTPTIFAENAVELFKQMPSVEVLVRDKTWVENQRMNTFLSVAKSSSEPPVFLEVKYKGGSPNSQPVVLVGKGITFDTGGINLKGTPALADMRGDKGGAACVLGTTYAVAKLGLPINVTTLIPLCENMPNSNATKPGDVVRAMNGKTVRIDNTDAEGRLILADALCYSKNFNPKFIVDVATLTGAMAVALGFEATGVFTNSNELWRDLHSAGMTTGDRVWRMPLWKSYSKGLTDHLSVDISNIRKSSGGGACSAAAFLREFIPPVDWIHLDIAGVMGPNDELPYLGRGMTGRPTRTLVEFLSNMK